MKREMLIRNISYMQRELSDMKNKLAMMDAKVESLEPTKFQSKHDTKQSYRPKKLSEQG